MPIQPEIKRLYYGYDWQTVIRRDVFKFWGRACVRCHSPWKPLDICHLDQNPANRDISNLVPMCKACHRKHDYPAWIEKFRIWADGKRPILVYLAEQAAIDRAIEGVAMMTPGMRSRANPGDDAKSPQAHQEKSDG